VGDPFTEKLLLEATLEVIRAEYLIGIQDMGAAGITCSTMEMSAKGKSGMRVDLDKVPVRETGMSAYEIMLSESQERMLLVVKKGCEEQVKSIFDKWDLHSVVIGEVTNDGIVRVFKEGELKAEVPAESLVLGGGAPVYIRNAAEPAYIKDRKTIEFHSLRLIEDYGRSIKTLLASPNIASKRWVFEQYDSMVRTNTSVLPGSDAAVVRIKGTEKFLAMKTDCNGRYVYLNPRKGAEIAVAEAARNVVCSGATPIGITNCLNFGNPYKPESFWQFKEAVAGIGHACRVFKTPVTGGNVSFYNESPDGSIYPTPVIGMVGLIENRSHITTAAFKNPGDDIILLGKNCGDINGSEYLHQIFGLDGTDAPHFDIEEEQRVQECCLKLIHRNLIASAHDVSDGGVAIALAEGAIFSPFGCAVEIPNEESFRTDFLLFGEEQSRIIITSPRDKQKEVTTLIKQSRVDYSILGVVTQEDKVLINEVAILGGEELRRVYSDSLGKRMIS
jgi:phosphoribosylformylglycinamidine synthase